MAVSSKQKAEDQFIERFGLFFEGYSMYPRIAGRIFAYLLICDPPNQSAKQLTERLQISKSSVSGMMRLLLQANVVEQVSIPRVRERFYRVREKGWEQMFFRRLKTLAAVRELLVEGITLLQDKNAASRVRIEVLDAWYSFFEKEIPLLTQRWEEYKHQRFRM